MMALLRRAKRRVPGILASFVHIPPLARGSAARRKGSPRITLEELVDAGEAMLLETVVLARQAARAS